ncbi:LuxR family transcriptional regulator [Saccharopolyspora gloriosae]|uniref:LuxR family transcriptional regulator n=1 Tax=Saccharopolyspora gloriosae TaxID=455344 RepID=UPI001FB64A02|nr:LuxR family transcriptional regulator [Saccharopolyspora gloriosae]
METTSLTELAAERLSAAKRSRAGRATSTVHGGSEASLRQVLLAFTAGHALAEHERPGEATLQVLRGSVRVTTPTGSLEAEEGDHLVLPFERHGLTAVSDAVVLLTVSLPRTS